MPDDNQDGNPPKRKMAPLSFLIAVSGDIARSSDLSIGAKGLYLFLISYPPDFPFSGKRLCQKLGISSALLAKCREELESQGILEVISNFHEDGGRAENSYFIVGNPNGWGK